MKQINILDLNKIKEIHSKFEFWQVDMFLEIILLLLLLIYI